MFTRFKFSSRVTTDASLPADISYTLPLPTRETGAAEGLVPPRRCPLPKVTAAVKADGVPALQAWAAAGVAGIAGLSVKFVCMVFEDDLQEVRWG